MRKMIIIGCMIAVSTVHGGVICSGDSAPITLDLRTGTRESTGAETLTYSSLWDGDNGASVTIAQDGAALVEGLTGEGERAWSVTRNGTYVLTHTTYTNGVAGKVKTATFVVTGKSLPIEVAFEGVGIAAETVDGWNITLTNNVSNTVTLTDDLGEVVLDLNGHSIIGAASSAGIKVVHGAGTGTHLKIVDLSQAGTAVVRGGGGYKLGRIVISGCGDGVEVVVDAVGVLISIGVNVLIEGGYDGWYCEGGAGVHGDVSENRGTISGGSGGLGNSGGIGVNGCVRKNVGKIRGGAGGQGITSDDPGTDPSGGYGGIGVAGDVSENSGTIVGGDGGAGGENLAGGPTGYGGTGGTAVLGTMATNAMTGVICGGSGGSGVHGLGVLAGDGGSGVVGDVAENCGRISGGFSYDVWEGGGVAIVGSVVENKGRITDGGASVGVSLESYTYDGNGHDLVIAISNMPPWYVLSNVTIGGESVVPVDWGDWNYEVRMADAYINAGIYSPLVRIVATNNNDNHEDVNEFVASMTISPKSISGCSVASIPDVTYTGSAFTPEPMVTDVTRGATLVKGTDYTLSYANNVNAGTAIVTITGKGNYMSSTNCTFVISRRDISSDAVVTLGSGLTYNGQEQAQSVSGVKAGGLTVPNFSVSANKATDAGTYTLTVTGMGNFSGSATKQFSIARKNIAGATVTLDGTLTYTGQEQQQSVSAVTINGLSATFDVANNSATTAGAYTLTVTGKGNFTGSTTKQFTVAPKPLAAAMVGAVRNATYTGSAHKPEPAVTDAARGVTLVKGADYTLSWGENTAAGSGIVTVTGKGNYAGSIQKPFTIGKQIVPLPTMASKPYSGGQQVATAQNTARYIVVANAGGVDVGEYDVVLQLRDSANYKWPSSDEAQISVKFAITKASNSWIAEPSIANWTYGQAASVPNMGAAKFGTASVTYSATPQNAGNYTATFTVAGTANYTGLTKVVPFTIAKATYDMSNARWDYAGAFRYDGNVKTVGVSGLPSGVTVSSYSGNTATVPGTYTAHAALAYDTVNYSAPAVPDLVWVIKSEDQVRVEEAFGDLPAAVEPDGAGGWKVTVTNDIDSADLPIEIPDNLGPITLDLGGHDLIGADGADGDATTPGGDGAPAIRIVPGAGAGDATVLSLTSTGGDALVAGGDGGAGNPGGNGAPAVAVSDYVKDGVKVVVGAGVTVQGGAGGAAVGEGASPGNDAPAVEGGDAAVSGGTLVKVLVALPEVPDAEYTGHLQTAAVPTSPLYDIVQNAGGVDAGQYDVKLRLVDPRNYAWPSGSGADAVVKFTVAKAANGWTAAPSIEGWTVGQAASAPDMGAAKFGTVTVAYRAAAGGAPRASLPSDPGRYVATFSVAGTANYTGLSEDVPFEVKSAEEEELEEIFEDLPAVVEPDGAGGWKVTLTNDLDLSEGPLEIPDNLGPITLDLGGHDLIGADGADGDATTPGGDGSPAIRIVPGAGGGPATEVSIITTGGDALVAGGGGGAGNPGGNGAPAVKVSDGCQGGVKVNVGEGVTVQGGKGGDSETGRGGDGGAGISGNVGTNDGEIVGGAGGASVSGDGGDGGPGVDGSVDVNNGSVSGGDGGVSEHGRGGDGGQGVTGDIGINNGTVSGGKGGETADGMPGEAGKAVGGTVGGGTGTVRKVMVPVPEVPSAEYTGEAVAPQVPASPLYAVSASGGTRPGSYPVMLTLLDAVNYGWIPRAGATVNGAIAVVNFVIVDPPPRIETEGGGKPGRENAASVTAVYDGAGHGISVAVTYPPSGARIRYALSEAGPYAAEKPLFTNAVEAAETWYELSADGFDPVTNVATVTVSPRSLADAAVGSLRFEDRGGVRTPVPALVDDLGHGVPPSDYAFAWSEAPNGAMTLSFTGRGNYLGLFEKTLAQTRFRVTFDARGGTVDADGADYDIGTYYGVLPVPTKPGYVFDGWYESLDFAPEHAVTRNTEVIAQDTTLYAKWLRRALWYTDAVFHLENAATYDGYLLDTAAGEAVAGTVSVKVGKPHRVTAICKLTVTLQIAGERKVTLKAETFDGSVDVAAPDGRALRLRLGAGAMAGTFGRYAVDGARNIFAAKDADSKVRAAQALKRWQGTYVVAWPGASGWNGMSVAVGSKGKAKAAGTLSDGTKVAATTQLLVGERECAIAVSWTKRGVSVACLVWFCEDGSVECANLPGGVLAQAANARTGAYLPAGAALRFDADALRKLVPGAVAELLPEGLAVRMNGAKFDIDRAGKVKLLKDKSGIDMEKAGTNPSGLKLSYAIKTCTFKGGFTAYAVQDGRLKKTSVSVSGVVLGGKGYGTASVRKVGSIPVTIE